MSLEGIVLVAIVVIVVAIIVFNSLLCFHMRHLFIYFFGVEFRQNKFLCCRRPIKAKR